MTVSRNGFAVQIDAGGAGVADAFAALADALGDLRPAFADIGGSIVASTMRRFDAETDPTGNPWTPLAPATILARLGGKTRAYTKKGTLRKKAQRTLAGMKILQNFGHLRQSVHYAATSDGVEIGSDLIYARIQQFGGDAGRDHKTQVPARPFLGLDDDDRALIADTLRQYLAGMARFNGTAGGAA